jgi:hypothetical protein
VRRPRLSARLAVAVAVLGLALPGGAALAFWTASGQGSGGGSTGTAQSLTVTAVTPPAHLRPGGQDDVALTLSNPNPFPVRVPSLELDTGQGSAGFAVDAAHSGCGLGTLSFTTQANGGAGWTIPARVGVTNGQSAVNLPGAVAMGSTAADACQGASFTVFVRVGP